MLRIECNGCHTAGYADCACSTVGHDPVAAGAHATSCTMSDLGAAVVCPPDSDCCDGSAHPDLTHDQAANACATDHSDHACPAPARDLRKLGIDEDCPGGHHGLGVQDCSVCRPVTIEVMPGSVNLVPVVGG